MTTAKPAWSEQFEPQTLKGAPPLHLATPIDREWAWGKSSGAGVKVAVIDSGVEENHPAVSLGLAGAVAFEWNEETEEVEMTEGPHEDLFGHGTACAGII